MLKIWNRHHHAADFPFSQWELARAPMTGVIRGVCPILSSYSELPNRVAGRAPTATGRRHAGHLAADEAPGSQGNPPRGPAVGQLPRCGRRAVWAAGTRGAYGHNHVPGCVRHGSAPGPELQELIINVLVTCFDTPLR